ncbi:hypothetical protein POVWA2_021620 [Plasmodium ovale wallikeri]|uniref:Uncharacterized protein n=1 Tax=Plasmodium ovale wallikeri TaxID=864142 RepID=A0A1A8YTB6_PLAOA|nr:hypothetical protein POVWA1_021640 [Plasmodium ovale wallikeri]SBT34761.1 hypothetical protein POVWA2_021620 [Plasmodium ovale wallikeri]
MLAFFSPRSSAKWSTHTCALGCDAAQTHVARTHAAHTHAAHTHVHTCVCSRRHLVYCPSSRSRGAIVNGKSFSQL